MLDFISKFFSKNTVNPILIRINSNNYNNLFILFFHHIINSSLQKTDHFETQPISTSQILATTPIVAIINASASEDDQPIIKDLVTANEFLKEFDMTLLRLVLRSYFIIAFLFFFEFH